MFWMHKRRTSERQSRMEKLVDSGSTELSAAPIASHHGEIVAERPTEHGVGLLRPALLQRRANAGAAHREPAEINLLRHRKADSIALAQFPQLGCISRASPSKTVIIPTRKSPRMEAAHQNLLDKRFRRKAHNLLKINHTDGLCTRGLKSPQTHPVITEPGRSAAPQHSLRMLPKDHRTGQQLPSARHLHGLTDHCTVASVHAVKISQCKRGSCLGQGVKISHIRHGLSSFLKRGSFHQVSCSTRRTFSSSPCTGNSPRPRKF